MSKEITISIPFTYELGEVGFYTGKILETVEDCKDEVRAEIAAGINENEVNLKVERMEGEARELTQALENFKNAWFQLGEAWEDYNPQQEIENYPFEQSFDEYTRDVAEWVEEFKEGIKNENNDR